MSTGNQFSENAPYHAPGAFPPVSRSRSSSRTILLIILGSGLALGLLCCGGFGAVMMFGFNVITAEIKDQVRDNPKLREHIGEVKSLEIDWMGSMAAEGDDTFRYRVRGTKGEGELTITHHTDEEGDEVIDEAWLRRSDGTKVKIIPDENE